MKENNYKMNILPSFKRDLIGIKNYIAYRLENKVAARNFVILVRELLAERLKNPKISEKYIPIMVRSEVYYKINVKNFTIFYVLKKDNVMEVRRIIYSKRNLNKII